MTDTAYDLVVIGAGPGGYVAAIRAAQLGMKTAVIEREHLGGICLNWGCIPAKALLRSAEAFHLMRRADEFGLTAEGVGFNLEKIVARSRAVSKKLAGGVGYLLKKNKVTVIDGTAKLKTAGVVTVTNKDGKPLPEISAKHIIIATGARARTLPGLEAGNRLIWTYKQALVADTMPKSLLVVGSGAIGIEFASFFNTLGAKTTVIEVLDRVLPTEDAEISALARKAFERQGMTIHTGAKVDALKAGFGSVNASLQLADGQSETLTVDRVILAVGITGNVEGLGLEELGVKVEHGHIVTGDFGETGVPGVYAIGDVAGAPWLAHKASHEAIICVEKIAGLPDIHPLDAQNIPGCTYCTPQVASVGLSETAAKEAGYEVRVGRFPFQANGKAIALGEPDGLVKTVFDAKTGALLGAHMIGAEVTEMIQGYAIGKTLETTEAELMHTVFPHPTLSEAMHEATLDHQGKQA
ncbi:MAG: dihydrolipoyl dehydrogenase [Alphaproteobacteria bacterium]